MSTRLLLEGPDIDTLLERVRAEYGVGARILNADRVRSGGVAGFFAKQRYVVTVEVDADEAPATAAHVESSLTPTAARTLAALAEAADLAESRMRSGTSSPADAAVYAIPADALSMVSAGGAPGMTVGVRRPGRAVSTESSSFGEVLDTFQQLAAEPTLSADPTYAPTPVPSPESIVRQAPVVAPVPEPLAALPVTVVPVTVAPIPAQSPLPDSTVDRLTGLGLPTGIAIEVAARVRDGARLNLALAAALSEVMPSAAALAAGAGDVIVVTGSGDAVAEAARQLAQILHVDPLNTLVARADGGTGGVPARQVLQGVDAAERRAASLRRRETPTIVSVTTGHGRDDAAWAREMADALGASSIYAVVDATRKPADVRAQLAGLGRITGLLVADAANTADPGTALAVALSMRVPTPLVDGRRGDARAWASLLVELLSRADLAAP